MLPYGEMRTEDLNIYKPMILNSYVLVVLFSPAHWLFVLFVYTPIYCIGGYYQIVGINDLIGSSTEQRKTEINAFLGFLSSFIAIMVLVAYRIQKFITDLLIKNKVSNQQQDDVQRVLQNSTDGLMVYAQPKMTEEELLSTDFVPKVLYVNTRLSEITGFPLSSNEKERITDALKQPCFEKKNKKRRAIDKTLESPGNELSSLSELVRSELGQNKDEPELFNFTNTKVSNDVRTFNISRCELIFRSQACEMLLIRD